MSKVNKLDGSFYTPHNVSLKCCEYIEKALGEEWYLKDNIRVWDMAAGKGDLEFCLADKLRDKLYLSTLHNDDVEFLKEHFKDAFVFHHDFLNDDLNTSDDAKKLLEDISNDDIEWVILINPPYGTSNDYDLTTGKRSKGLMSDTAVKKQMCSEGLVDSSRDLNCQFLYRVIKMFSFKKCHLCVISPTNYINGEKTKKFRNVSFRANFLSGFLFPSNLFEDIKSKFPISFCIWDVNNKSIIESQDITLDVLDDELSIIFKKNVAPSTSALLNEWVPKFKNKNIMPPFKSGFNVGYSNKDVRNLVADGFLFSMKLAGNFLYAQRLWSIFSSPHASAGAFSVTPDNFEKAMVAYAVKKVPRLTWYNGKDFFYSPSKEVDKDFITDCVIFSCFNNQNQIIASNDVEYNGKSYNLKNELFPFESESYLWKWLQDRSLSAVSYDVLLHVKELYFKFYKIHNLINLDDFMINRPDVSFFQIKKAILRFYKEDFILDGFNHAYSRLRDKIQQSLPFYGFLR